MKVMNNDNKELKNYLSEPSPLTEDKFKLMKSHFRLTLEKHIEQITDQEWQLIRDIVQLDPKQHGLY